MFTYSIDGDEPRLNESYATADEAMAHATDDFIESCEEMQLENKEIVDAVVTIYVYQEDFWGHGLNPFYLYEEDISYEHYHGDKAEHFSQGDYI